MTVIEPTATRPWGEWVRRIIVVVPRFATATGEVLPGGRERHTQELARVATATLGASVEVVQLGAIAWRSRTRCGLDVRCVRLPSAWWAYPMLARVANRHASSSTAVLYAGGEDAYPFFARGSKAVQHGIWWDGPRPRGARLVSLVRSLAMMRRCRSVLAVDTNYINWLRAVSPRGYLLAEKTAYVPNCTFDPAPTAPATDARHPSDPVRILFVRRWEHKRGGELLLAALAHLRDSGHSFTATFAPGEGGVAAAAAIAAYGLTDRVQVVDAPLDSVFELYRTHDVAVVPSLWSEGTAFGAAEALGAGVPVVATTVGGLPNLILDGFNGRLVHPNVSALAAAIREISEPESRQRFRENARMVAASFNRRRWEDAVASWLAS